MRLQIKLALLAVATLFFCLAFSTADACAKGKGGDKKNQRSDRDREFRQPSWRNDRWGRDRDQEESRSWSRQRAKEEQKLNHQLAMADKLDELAERNGNSQLHETAARKREKAWEHYEKRLAKINSKNPNYVPPEEDGGMNDDSNRFRDSDVVHDDNLHSVLVRTGTTSETNPYVAIDPLDHPVGTVPRLTGREDTIYQQLRNEQLALAQRMEVAEQLWDAYEETGDEEFAVAARALEDRALRHFERRTQAVPVYQERYRLPDAVRDVMETIEVLDSID